MTAYAQTGSPSATGGEPDGLESGLVRAMRPNAQRDGRLTESGEAIRPYITAGYLRLKPELREDYTDYRIVRKPAKLFGQELVVIEEEYQLKFVGCCVNEGIGAVVRVTADLAALKQFAAANGCSLNTDAEVVERLRKLKLPARGAFLSISCRERDMEKR